MDKMEVIVRPMIEEDYNFVIQSWLKSYKHNSYFCKRIRDNIYYKYHHKVITQILARASTSVLIAIDPVEKVILGYLVTEKFENKDLVHYAYVKTSFRDLGIGGSLLKESGINPFEVLFSHWTKDTDGLIEKYKGATYVPYLL